MHTFSLPSAVILLFKIVPFVKVNHAFLVTSSIGHTDAVTFLPVPSLLSSIKSRTILHSAEEMEPEIDSSDNAENKSLPKEWTPEQTESVSNLCADDEWMGLSMELSELVRVAVVEDLKKNTKDFIGKDDYKVGDIAKEIDDRVKGAIAEARGKDEYELGDLSVTLDQISKDVTCKLTGKEDYEFGDLSTELDKRVKESVADFCGNDDYQFGDLTMEIDRRSQKQLLEFIQKDEYEFGDISREVEDRRKQWMKDILGEEAADRYEFGDLTKNAVSSFTGKEDYEFGDVTKKVLGNLFGKRKRGGDGN